MKISLCMIVKNEEEVLERCLSSIKDIVDEIVIVDTGSTDKTIELAKKFTDRVYSFDWVDDFSKARNYAFSKGSCDYLMWLDADDVILESEKIKLLELKKTSNPKDCYMMRYVTDYDQNYKPLFSFYRERIVKNSPLFRWIDPVHEVIIPSGEIEYLDIAVYHSKPKSRSEKHSSRNLDIYRSYINEGNSLSPRQQFYYARELMFNSLIDESILELEKFLKSKKGWVENNIEACQNLARCYRIKNEDDKALLALFQSFCFALPRGEILCELAEIFIGQKRYDEAVYYLKQARTIKPDLNSGAFIKSDSYDFIPNLLLCVCYYYKGELKKASYYHKLAKKLKPNHPSVIYNEQFFKV